MIWPTEIGTFLIRRGDRQPAATGQVPAEADPLVARTVPAVDGYLAAGPGRPLRWASPVESATSTVVLRFERSDRSRSGNRNLAAADAAPLSLEANDEPGGVLVAEDSTTYRLQSEQLPPVEVAVEEPEEAPPATRRSVLDEKFVNWVTRRMDDTKVEIPFQLPTETTEGEPVAPTERVRVRYRTEP